MCTEIFINLSYHYYATDIIRIFYFENTFIGIFVLDCY